MTAASSLDVLAHASGLTELAGDASGLVPALEAVLDALPDGILVLGGRGEVAYANAAARDLAVHDRRPSSRDLWADLWETVRRFDVGLDFEEESFVARVLAGEDFEDDVQFFRSGPSGRWIAGTGRAIRGPAGGQRGGVLLLRDVTARRAAERTLEASEKRFRELVEGLDAVFWVLSPAGGKLVYLSPSFERIWGIPVEVAQSDPEAWLRAVHEEDRERLTGLRAQLAEGQGYDEIYRLVRADGQVRWVRDRARPAFDDTGDLQRVTGLVADVTDLIETQFELVSKSEALARSNAELEQFARVASHDLQEPLRMVSSYCEIVSAEHGHRLDDEGRECLAFARDGALRMQRLIQDLLRFSKVKTDASRFGPVDLCSVADRAVHDLTALLDDYRATVDVLPSLPVVHGDQGLLERLVGNLVSNAAKHAGDGVRIRILAQQSSDEHRVVVEDDGIGIAPESLARIFEPFHRLRPEDDRRPGSGMGLAIARRIAELHGGRLTVESSVGVGSRFTLVLPAERPPERPDLR